MEKTKFQLKNYVFLMLIVLSSSCKKETTEYPTIEYQPCEDINVVVDPNIITDFECQSNKVLPDVEVIRNPSEIQINTSKFVGKYTDGSGAWDGLIIDFDSPVDLSTHSVFKIKIKTAISGVLIAKLEGGSSIPVEADADVTGDNGWAEYTFDFSVYLEENYTKLVLYFNAGVDTDGSDIYYIDDLFFDVYVDPCSDVLEDLNIINDFDCQVNLDIPNVTKVMTPGKSVANNSNYAGKYIDGLGAWDAVIIDYESQIDLSTNNLFKIKVLAPVTGILKVKLEGGTSGAIEKDVEITQTGEWVEYEYDFSSQALENHTKVILFFNAGVDTDGTHEYFVDDIQFVEIIDPCANIIVDNSIINDFDCQNNVDPLGSAVSSIIENPYKTGINTTNNVLEVTDNGTDAWDYLSFDYGTSIDLSVKNYLKIKIHSSKVVPLLAKLEGGTSAASEIWGSIDVVGEWTEYTFDFSSQATENHNKVLFFFNGGQADGTANDIYYVDEIKFIDFDPCNGVVSDNSIVNDAECQQNYTIGGNAVTIVINNPDKSGINTTNSVLEVTDDGTNAWDHLLFNFGENIDLSTKNTLKIKVLSSKIVPLLAKLEGGSSAANEIWGSINVSGSWTEYTFNFSAQAAENHQKIVFFFNGGQADGTASDIYYVDDVKWE